MRQKIIAGNWKMNSTRAEGIALASAITEKIGKSSAVGVVVCPPSVYLDAVGQAIEGSAVALGGQNC
jgi:triosephosphate isomerase